MTPIDCRLIEIQIILLIISGLLCDLTKKNRIKHIFYGIAFGLVIHIGFSLWKN